MLPHAPEQTSLIGRAQELDRLRDLALRRAGGSGANVLVGGEAGVGKSRLVSELGADLVQRGWQVVVGHCLDFGANALPYLAFSEIFERLAQLDPDRIGEAMDAHPVIQRLLPGALPRPDSHEVKPDADRMELFAALRAVLATIAAEKPLLVVIEDLHWADRSTQEAMSFLFAQELSGQVALIGTYRSDDLYRGHPLRARLAEWGRIRSIARISLQPLGDDEVRTLIKGVGPHITSEQTIGTIVERAQGNAFFAEELAAAPGIGHRHLPDDLADLLLIRVDQSLTESGRQLVRAASSIGRKIGHHALEVLVPADESHLEEALREAIENHVLVSLEDDTYGFRHALLAEAVYHDLLPGERLRFHTAYSAALSTGEVAGSAAELARHSYAARDYGTAVRASIQAGRQAMSVGGAEEAARHFELASELTENPETDADIDVVDLALLTADALNASGHSYRAAAILDDRLRMPTALDSMDQARLWIGLAQACLHSEYPRADALESSTRALGVVSDSVSETHAEALETHARANTAYGRFGEAAQFAHKALAMAQELDNERLIVAASTTLGRLKERTGDAPASILALSEIVDQARESGDTAGIVRGLHQLTAITFGSGDLATARDHAQQCAQIAASSGSPWSPFGLGARVYLRLIDYMLGNWQDSDDYTQRSVAAPPDHAQALLDCPQSQIAVSQGMQQKHELIERLRPWWSKDGWCAVLNVGAAIDGYGDDGDIVAAISAYDQGVSAIRQVWHTERFSAQTRWIALLTGQMANSAPTSSAQHREDLLRRGNQLAAILDHTPAAVFAQGVFLGPEGLAWQLRQRAELLRLRWLTDTDTVVMDDLISAWEQTVESFTELGHVFEIARSQVRLAAVHRAAGDLKAARVLATEAHQVAQRLGAAPLSTEIVRLGLLDASPVTADSLSAPELTPRELDVLELVVAGRSNGQIAKHLFISTKTVSVHVSNILAKLGVASRTEAATVAHRQALLGP